jgi:Mg-chelatase subunit ChlD
MEYALVILLLAVPGLVVRRGGPGMARFAAFVALLAIGFAALDLTREILTPVRPMVAVIPTASLSESSADSLRKGLGADANVRFEPGRATLDHRIGRARLRHREDPRLVLWWTGPLRGAEWSGLAQRQSSADALSDVPVIPLDPDDVEVRVLTAPRAGRPAALEVALGSGGGDVRGRVWVNDPEGQMVAEKPFVGGATAKIEWQPRVPGTHEVHLVLHLEHVELRGAGVVEVADAPTVTIVGRRGKALAKALIVQGLKVRHATALPDELSGTLVLLDALDQAEQQRVRVFVEDAGGGLFLVGGENAGAVPGDEEVLAALSPVRRPPLPKATGPKPRGADDKGSDPAKGDKPTPGKPDKPKQTDGPAKGDTTGARLKAEEREVKRRSIAMVLVIDRSGSMTDLVKGSVSRMDLAKASAKQTAQALDEQDKIGIVSFGESNKATVVLPMTSTTETARIAKKLASLRAADEATCVAHGLDLARQLLEKVDATIKYVVVITDGELHDVRDSHTGLVADRYKKEGLSLCIVQVLAPNSHTAFDAAATTLELARRGNGDVIEQTSFEGVPRVMSAEVERLRVQVGRPKRRGGDDGDDGKGDKRQPDKPDKPKPPDPTTLPKKPDAPKLQQAASLEVNLVEDSRLLEPRDSDVFPPVAGILQARGRPGARVLLSAGTEGYVLLAFANRGLGKVGVWSADFLGPWGVSWAADPAFPGRLAQWIQSLEPAAAASRGTRVVHRPELSPAVPVPREAALLESITGSALRPVDTFVPPASRIHTEIRGRAAQHAWYGLVFLVLLAAIECLLLRRLGRRTI